LIEFLDLRFPLIIFTTLLNTFPSWAAAKMEEWRPLLINSNINSIELYRTVCIAALSSETPHLIILLKWKISLQQTIDYVNIGQESRCGVLRSKLSVCDIYGLENVGIIDISRYVMIKWTKSDVILTVYSLEISRLELYKITATSGGKNSVQQEWHRYLDLVTTPWYVEACRKERFLSIVVNPVSDVCHIFKCLNVIVYFFSHNLYFYFYKSIHYIF